MAALREAVAEAVTREAIDDAIRKVEEEEALTFLLPFGVSYRAQVPMSVIDALSYARALITQLYDLIPSIDELVYDCAGGERKKRPTQLDPQLHLLWSPPQTTQFVSHAIPSASSTLRTPFVSHAP